jgi:hypothetical protein
LAIRVGKVIDMQTKASVEPNAYSPEWHSAANTGPLRQNDNGNLPTPPQPVGNPDSNPAHDTPSPRSQIKER